eukprot:IDg5611t1
MSQAGRKSTLGKRVRDAFFTRDLEDENMWHCICKTKRKQSGSGYANLISHVQTRHAEQLRNLRDVVESETSTTRVPSDSRSIDLGGNVSYFYQPKVLATYGWIRFVTSALLPFSVVENDTYQRQSKYRSVSRPTLMKYMFLLTNLVEGKIRELLPKCFALAFDGWTE